MYVPAHLANLDLLTSFNPLTTRPVACGIIQWSRAFLTARRAEILSAARNDQPLGRHVEYPQFSRRNEIVRALSAHFPDVQLSTVEYHRHSPAERLAEWCGHMCHWIVPVGDDCPIRLFDALATGGVPLVPRSLINVEEVRAVADHVVFYGDADIESPQRVVDAGNRLFRDRGPAGILERHSAGVMNHHMDARIERILDAVAAAFLHADRKAEDVPRSTIIVRM